MSTDTSRARMFEMGDELLRSWWTVVAGVCFGLAGALLALDYLPKVYSASTQIRIAPQSIPEEFIESTVTDDMSHRLVEIQQAILNRANMLDLIEKNFAMPPDESGQDALIRALQRRVQVKHLRNSWLFVLTYQDTDPQRAAGVVNNLTRLYVDQNKEFRSSQAQNTRETFESLAQEALAELTSIERQLQEFNADHFYETEAFLGANLQMLDARQRELIENRTRQGEIENRLESQRLQAESGDGTSIVVLPGVRIDPTQARIVELQRELDDLRTTYLETHPEVVKKKRQLDDLIAASGGRTKQGTDDTAPPPDPRMAAVQTQIDATERELVLLRSEEQRLRLDIVKIESRINITPEIQTRLTDLEEEHRVVEERYRDLKAKAERARSSEFLEQSDKGQRLEVIEYATVPFKPVSPAPGRVYLLGLAVGLALFVGPLLLRRFLNPLVSSEAGLRAIIDAPVLVSIPRIPTADNAGLGRRRLLKNVSFSVLSTAALAAVLALLRWPG